MIAKYNRLSFVFGVPGVVLQIAANCVAAHRSLSTPSGVRLFLFGTALLLIGLALYAKAKGRETAWCFLAFLPIIGLIVLALLQDRSGSTSEAGEKHEQT